MSTELIPGGRGPFAAAAATVTVAIACAIAGAGHAGVLYAVDSNRSLYIINTTTGAKTLIGTVSSNAGTPGALAFNPLNQRVVMTSMTNDALFRVNLVTGQATLEGGFGGDAAIAMDGLEWDSVTNGGTLLGVSNHNNGLYRISNNGAATLVGTSVMISFTNIGFDSDNNILYGVNSAADQLVTFNRATGAVTFIGPLMGPTNPSGMAFDPESHTLYLIDSSTDNLYTVNRTTGATTLVGSTGVGNLVGLVFIPDPACGGDADNNSTVNINDLLTVINNWGACPGLCTVPCVGDIAPFPDTDCAVNINDLTMVINTWGGCP